MKTLSMEERRVLIRQPPNPLLSSQQLNLSAVNQKKKSERRCMESILVCNLKFFSFYANSVEYRNVLCSELIILSFYHESCMACNFDIMK